MNTTKKKTKSPIHNIAMFALLGIILIQLGLGINSLTKVKGIPSYDAYYFVQVSKYIQDTEQIPFNTPNTYTPTPIDYQTSHTVMFSLVSDFTGIDIDTLYKYAAPPMFSLLLLSFYLICRRCSKNAGISLLGVMFLGLIPYNLYRSTMPLPEGTSLLFQILIVIVLANQKISIKHKALVASVLLAGATYAHYRSIIISILIITVYFATTIFQSWKKKGGSFKHFVPLLSLITICIILTIPLIKLVFNTYLYYLSPQQYSWKEIEPLPARYVLPTLSEYTKQLGTLNLTLGIIGLFAILRKRGISPLLLTICLWFLATLAATQSIRFGFYAPPYRFYSFFSLPLALAATFAIVALKNTWSKTHKYKLASIIIALVSLYTVSQYTLNNINKAVWVGFQSSDFQAAALLKEQSESSITISNGAFPISLGIPNSEARLDITHSILLSENENDVEQKLTEHYPNNNNVYLLIIRSMATPFTDKYVTFQGLLQNYDMVFDQNGTKIYKLR
ncbi:MAG: hypothetical protein HN929_07995 [Chloroflexi bacterium]|jgi:hypothetical protein|nr:hypothetical protein [Chloroflexota bacterium]MBT7081390.1 hypothetical protein [Chloroflexota bacterium]